MCQSDNLNIKSSATALSPFNHRDDFGAGEGPGVSNPGQVGGDKRLLFLVRIDLTVIGARDLEWTSTGRIGFMIS